MTDQRIQSQIDGENDKMLDRRKLPLFNKSSFHLPFFFPWAETGMSFASWLYLLPFSFPPLPINRLKFLCVNVLLMKPVIFYQIKALSIMHSPSNQSLNLTTIPPLKMTLSLSASQQVAPTGLFHFVKILNRETAN